jgi:hypothetical protein
MSIDRDELAIRFTYHPPIGDQSDRYERLRGGAFGLAEMITEATPPSREQSLALTHLEEAIMWANAAIARRDEPIDDDEPEDLEPEDG